MTLYRSKHAVEAMQWDGTNVEPITAWVTANDEEERFHVHGNVAFLSNEDYATYVKRGSWLVALHGEVLVVDDEQFRAEYEEVTNG